MAKQSVRTRCGHQQPEARLFLRQEGWGEVGGAEPSSLGDTASLSGGAAKVSVRGS